MVKETRVVFDLTDIVSVRFVCAECFGEVVHHIDDKVKRIPDRCPACNAPWDGATGVSLAKEMAEVLRKAREWQQLDFKVLTRLELEETSS